MRKNVIIGASALAVSVCGLLGGCEAFGLQAAPGNDGEYQQTELMLAPMPRVAREFRGQTIAVAIFPDKAIHRGYPWFRDWLGSASTDFATEFLLDAGFRVVEGQGGDLDAVLGELELGRSGFIEADEAIEIGHFAGATYVYVGAITDYSEVRTDGSKRVNIQGTRIRIGGETITYHVQTTGRIVDVRTREIVASSSASFKKTYKAGSGSFSYEGISIASDQDTRVRRESSGRIFQQALNGLTIKLIRQLNAQSAE